MKVYLFKKDLFNFCISTEDTLLRPVKLQIAGDPQE